MESTKVPIVVDAGVSTVSCAAVAAWSRGLRIAVGVELAARSGAVLVALGGRRKASWH
jgi:thiazole synthase ThiGH ThiG subunit